jgi:hypothetical protein
LNFIVPFVSFNAFSELVYLNGTPGTQGRVKELASGDHAKLYDIRGQQIDISSASSFSGLYFQLVEHSEPASRAEAGLAKTSAVDNLVLTYGGELLQTEVVDNYVGTMNITLQGSLSTVNVGSHALPFDKLIFIKRESFKWDHYYGYYNEWMDLQYAGNIYIKDLNTGQETKLVPELDGGLFGHLDLSWDARRVVFDYKPGIGEGFRIWEVNVDGTGLRQLTFDPPGEAEMEAHMVSIAGETYPMHKDDLEPAYLPDGGIVFVSTRSEYGVLCDPGYLSVTLLHRMDADGGNMRRLSNNALNEFSPAVGNDGRVIYHRWEYVDKGSICLKSLWSVNPDGSNSVEVFGNNIPDPNSFVYPKPVPGDNNLFICIAGDHAMNLGPILKLDTRNNIRTLAPIVNTVEGTFNKPWPLSENLYLAAYSPSGFSIDQLSTFSARLSVATHFCNFCR